MNNHIRSAVPLVFCCYVLLAILVKHSRTGDANFLAGPQEVMCRSIALLVGEGDVASYQRR